MAWNPGRRNLRDVWTIPSESFNKGKTSHYASFPRRLVEICVKAASRPRSVAWPEPTHGLGCRGKKPWRTAAECIDWSIKVPSIFDRKRPLAENTLKRIAEGLRRFVIETDQPFVVPFSIGMGADYQTPWILQANTGLIGRAVNDPLSTICQTGSHQQLVAANLIHYYSTKPGQLARCSGLLNPLATVPCENRFGLTTAFLVKSNHTADYYRCFRGQDFFNPLQTITQAPGFSLATGTLAPFIQHIQHTSRAGVMDANAPLRTITAYPKGGGMALVVNQLAPFLTGVGGSAYGAKPASLMKPTGVIIGQNHRALVAASLSHFYGTMQDGQLVRPMKTVTADGQHSAMVTAFLRSYYGTSIGSPLDTPTRTATGQNKMGPPLF